MTHTLIFQDLLYVWLVGLIGGLLAYGAKQPLLLGYMLGLRVVPRLLEFVGRARDTKLHVFVLVNTFVFNLPGKAPSMLSAIRAHPLRRSGDILRRRTDGV